jgi:hypothetical protein
MGLISMNLLGVILFQEECVQDLSIIELFHRMQLKIKIIKAKLTMPVLAVGGEYYPAFTGNVTSNSELYAMKTLAQNVRGMCFGVTHVWIHAK